MKKLIEWLKGKKTHLSTAGLVLTGLAGLLNGDVTIIEFLAIAFGGAGMSSLRAGIAKK